MTLPRLLRIASPSLFVVIWFASAVMGQTETATVSGLVTDRTAAAVSGAEVRLQSAERGTVTTTTTNNSGIYVFPNVQPGQYQISIQKQGFKQVDLLGLIVNIQDHIDQNFRLEVGSVNESVTVEAGASMINTMDAQISLRVRQALRAELEEFAVRERRKLGNITELILEWAFEQLKTAGSTERLLKYKIRLPDIAATGRKLHK